MVQGPDDQALEIECWKEGTVKLDAERFRGALALMKRRLAEKAPRPRQEPGARPAILKPGVAGALYMRRKKE